MRVRSAPAASLARSALVLAIALAAGCASEPPAPTPPTPEKPPAEPTAIQALEPRDMAEQVTRRPAFQWKLPKRAAEPRLLSFTLAQAGTAAAPEKDEERQVRVAFASGLQTAGLDGIDPWKPPEGCVLTGLLTSMGQLDPGTWYRWSVRALGELEAAHATFYFRTRADDAVPPAPAPASGVPAPTN